MDINIRPRPPRVRISPVRNRGAIWWRINLPQWRGLVFPSAAAAMQQFDMD